MSLTTNGPRLPIYWGNRNWHPLLADTLRQMRDDGVQRALAFVTSAYSSYSGCRQYREDIERAREASATGAPRVDKLRAFYNHPGFVGPNVENLRAALEQIPAERRADAHVAFTAHSIPSAMAAGCDYERNCWRPAASSPRARAPRAGDSSSRAAAGRPRSPGSNPTSATTCAR